MSVPKYSSGHKAVQKANKQYPAVAYVNKKDAFANYTASQHSLLAAFSFFFFFLVHQARKCQFTFISQHSGFCYLPPDLYQHICVKAAGGRQRRGGCCRRGLCSDAVEVQQKWTARSEARARGKRQQLLDERAEPTWGCRTGSEDLECFCLISLRPHCKIAGSPAQAELKQVLKPFLCQYF